jgi:hypothetical protein
MNWYIVAPNYRNNSNGVVVLHQLCHYLNVLGEHAYLSAEVLNPYLLTETYVGYNPKHPKVEECVWVIPEIFSSPNLNVQRVVRYVLNEPGKIGGPLSYKNTELVIPYSKTLLPSVRKATATNVPDSNVLFIPTADTSIFHNYGGERKLTTFYVGKGIPPTEIGKDWVQITSTFPKEKLELAELLRASKVFVSFDGMTALVDEARLCGCPVVRFGDTQYDRAFLAQTETGDAGVAFSWDELEMAEKSLPEFKERYSEWKQKTLENVFTFIQHVARHAWQ